jgi:hypothetical protein
VGVLLAAEATLAGADLTGTVEGTNGVMDRGTLVLEQGMIAIRTADGTNQRRDLTQVRRVRFERLDVPPVTPAGEEKPGLQASYFPSTDFTGTAVERTDSEPGFRAGQAFPAGAGGAGFSARWEGAVAAVAAGPHRFHLRSTGTARLWVGGALVGSIVAHGGAPRESTGAMDLVADRRYDLVVECSQSQGEPLLAVEWSAPLLGLARAPLPPGRLLHVPGRHPAHALAQGFLATYYGTTELTDPRLTRVERQVQFDWMESDPLPEWGVKSRFSATWSGQFTSPRALAFQFGIETEGGVRLTVDGNRVYERWEDAPRNGVPIETFPINLEEGRQHIVRLDYFNSVGPSRVRFETIALGSIRTIITPAAFTPVAPEDRSIPVSDLPERGGGAAAATPGVILVDGSFYGRVPESGSATSLRFPANSVVESVPSDRAARVNLVPLPPKAIEQLANSRAGLLLHNGDFMEGEVRGFDATGIRMSSVLFGNRTVERDRVLAIVYRAATQAAAPWRVVLKDGSTLVADRIRVGAGRIQLLGGAFKGVEMEARELAEIARQP